MLYYGQRQNVGTGLPLKSKFQPQGVFVRNLQLQETGGSAMGTYLNPDNSKFQECTNSDIYVDKTGLINYNISI